MKRSLTLKLVVLMSVLLTALLSVTTASASGRVVWKKTKIKESNEAWRVELEFHMNKAPDFAHVPMQFKFEPKTYFERSLVDGNDEPQFRRVPLEGKAPLLETVDVGFMDPGTGKIQKRTRFTFKITRARGFEAGEYTVKVTNKRTGASVGSMQRLTLDGENEVIDRRSISFEPKKKKKKKEETTNSEPEYDPSKDPDNEAYWAGGPEEPERDPSLPPPAHLQDKPGGCGCRAVGHQDSSGAAWAALLLGLALSGARTLRTRS